MEILLEDGEPSQNVLGFDNKDFRIKWNNLLKIWRRPNDASVENHTKTLELFVVDVDTSDIEGNEMSTWALQPNFGDLKSPVTIVHVFGVTETQKSCVLNVYGLNPFFYVKLIPGLEKEDEAKLQEYADTFRNNLNKKGAHILKVEVVYKENLCGFSYRAYSGSKTEENRILSPFFKIIVASKKQLTSSRTAVKNYISTSNSFVLPELFETNIPLSLRFLVESGVTGCGWLAVNLADCVPTERVQEFCCNYEYDILFDKIVPCNPELDPRFDRIPKLRILSFDIECVKSEGTGFPEAISDPIIQISSILSFLGDSQPLFKSVFTLHRCSPIPDCFVFWFSNESDMLACWTEFVRSIDPDVLTGYNIVSFDIPYIVTRLLVLKLHADCGVLGRNKNKVSVSKDSTFSNKAFGTYESKETNIEGRIQLDVFEAVRRDYKLKSYTLNNVSFTFLQEQKEDVHYSLMKGLFLESSESRKRLAVYCIKDSYLAWRLLEKLMLVYNHVEMARVTGCPIRFLLTRGQQIKVVSQILRYAKGTHYVIPSRQGGSLGPTEKYDGGAVIEPEKNFYNRPIATLDFASLYPSIIMAYNLCYTTLVSAHEKHHFKDEDLTTTPTATPYYFVKKHVKKGILPWILESLLLARKKAKKQMSLSTDAMEQRVLNGRQLALKISANSVYGFTGAAGTGQLPCLEIAMSTTCYGRDIIYKTKEFIETRFTRQNNYPFDAKVIYGDTDSVMVDFAYCEQQNIKISKSATSSKRCDLALSLQEIMKLALDAAIQVTAISPSPIRLEFEKVYYPFLLMNKKRYAGLLYTNPNKYDKKDCKGIETVRRDTCLFVQNLVDLILNKILIDFDVEGAKSITKEAIRDLMEDRVDLSLLVVTKSLGKADYGTNLAHNQLAKKLRLRDPGNAPNVGDRISYVIVKGQKGQAQYDRAEDPLYVINNNLAIDTDHYFDSLKNPICRIFEAVMPSPADLFVGDHTRSKIVVSSTTNKMMMGFVVRKNRCIGCKKTVKDHEVFCQTCLQPSNLREIIIGKTGKYSAKEQQFNQLWAQCQRCQGSFHLEVICSNRDCPIFYRRMKIQKDLNALQADVDKMALSW